MNMRPVAVAVLLLLGATGCSGNVDALRPDAAEGSPTAGRDVTGTPAGNYWWLRTWPEPDDRTLDLMVHEGACASGQSAEGRIEPVVEYGDDSITVTISVEYAGGDQACPGNPDTPFTLTLEEAVEGREIRDGRTSPPSKARTSDPGNI